MLVRWATFLVWALVAASAVAWGLRLFVTPVPVPRDAQVAYSSASLRGDVSRVLGAIDTPAAAAPQEAAPLADARYRLIGVVAPRTNKPVAEGVALIAVDGKLPKAFRVGAAVDGETVLKSVRARGADLGPRDGAVTIVLDIAPPPPPPAAAGSLRPAALPPRAVGAAVPPLPSPVVTPAQALPGLTVVPPSAGSGGELDQRR